MEKQHGGNVSILPLEIPFYGLQTTLTCQKCCMNHIFWNAASGWLSCLWREGVLLK